MTTGRMMTTTLRRDMEYGDVHRISGYVSRLGVVGVYRVRLFALLGGVLIREKFSDADGFYDFPYIKYIENGYFIVAHDHTSGDQRNAAISDLVTPEPMP